MDGSSITVGSFVLNYKQTAIESFISGFGLLSKMFAQEVNACSCLSRFSFIFLMMPRLTQRIISVCIKTFIMLQIYFF